MSQYDGIQGRKTMSLALDTVKRIYRDAIDPRDGDGEGAAWWDAVSAEVLAVFGAPYVVTASSVIIYL